jgi:hypothetical protein
MWEQEIIGAYEGSFPVPATQSAAPGWGGGVVMTEMGGTIRMGEGGGFL